MLKAGLYELNSDFDTTNVGSLSVLSSHGIGSEFAQSGRNGPSIFPYASLAIRTELKPMTALTLRAAILDGVPDNPDCPRRTAIRLWHGDGTLAVAEADYAGSLANVTIGAWHYTAQFEPWPSGNAEPADADRAGRDNAGGYIVAERWLVRSYPLRTAAARTSPPGWLSLLDELDGGGRSARADNARHMAACGGAAPRPVRRDFGTAAAGRTTRAAPMRSPGAASSRSGRLSQGAARAVPRVSPERR